jgi:hypothetical protein
MANVRVQILLEPGQRVALARKAWITGRSSSDLVRDYVQRRGGKSIRVHPVEVIQEIREE